CPYDLVALLSCIFVSKAAFVTSRICSFSSDLLMLMQVGMRGPFRTCLSEFCEWSLKRLAARQDHGSLHEILEFTDVAGPVPSRQSLHCSRRNRFDGLLHFLGELLDEMADEQRNVFFAVSQRRNTDRKDIQPVIQITAKFPVRNHLLEIAIRGRHQADIRLPCKRAAETFKFPLLQSPQQLRLNLCRDDSHLIHKQSALVCQF